jgi:hypothetical protein
VTWAEVPTPETSEYIGWLAMESRGIWTDSGVLYGYDGVVRLKLQSKLPWLRIRVASLGSRLAIAGGEHHRTPKSEEDDAPFEWASAALYDDAGQPLWLRRWTAKPTQTQSTVLQVAPAPGGGFLVAGMHDGCMTFGKPHGRFCADEELEAPRRCGEEGCDEPFRLQYDANGELTDARTFRGVGGAPTLGPGGETAIYGEFYGKFDLKPGKGGLPVVGGLPGQPSSDSTTQGLLSFYDAGGKWRWGRAIVGNRTIGVSGAAFAPTTVRCGRASRSGAPRPRRPHQFCCWAGKNRGRCSTTRPRARPCFESTQPERWCCGNVSATRSVPDGCLGRRRR